MESERSRGGVVVDEHQDAAGSPSGRAIRRVKVHGLTSHEIETRRRSTEGRCGGGLGQSAGGGALREKVNYRDSAGERTGERTSLRLENWEGTGIGCHWRDPAEASPNTWFSRSAPSPLSRYRALNVDRTPVRSPAPLGYLSSRGNARKHFHRQATIISAPSR